MYILLYITNCLQLVYFVSRPMGKVISKTESKLCYQSTHDEPSRNTPSWKFFENPRMYSRKDYPIFLGKNPHRFSTGGYEI